MRIIFTLALFLSFSAALDSQQDAGATITPRAKSKAPGRDETTLDRRSDIRVDTNLVLIPVAVTDPLGKFVTGLEKENFVLAEEKIDQEITQFSSEDAPLSLGIVFDTSGSMGGKLQMARRAVKQFMKIANPEDEAFLIQFNDRPEMVVGFTSETEQIENRLMFAQSKGRTALLDGVYMAMAQMKKARNPRKAILIISDGGDNSSRYTTSEVKNAVREADVQVYGIGLFEQIGSRGTPEEIAGPDMLRQLAGLTGGRSFQVDNVRDLPDVAEKIAVELRYEYVLGYTPKNASRDGKYRRVQVRLARVKGLPPLKAAWRTGYYAPSQ
jgi:Ca-activated chloride channel homolog